MSSSGSGTPMVPPWAKSLLDKSQRAAPNASKGLGGAPQHVLGTVETPLTISTTHSPPDVLPMEMDDENDEDYNEDEEVEEEEEEEGDDDDMPLPHHPGADIPPSLHNTAPSTRGKAPMTRGVVPVTKPIPRAASISSSSGGSDIPDVLPSYRRGTSGSSSQATAENTASLKRGLAVGGGSVLKRPRISNLADGVFTSRLNEQQSSAVLQSRRRSDATRPMGISDEQEPHITNIESDVTIPGNIATPTFNTGAHVSLVDPNQSAQGRHDPYALPEHLTHAEDGRPYISMPGIDPSIKTKGALFPTGYQLRLDQQAPFVCAVRSCQTLLPTLKGLGSHFISKHSLCLFNDNLDGTMTHLGHYTVPAFAKGPPLIISRNPPRPDEMAPFPATVPNLARKRMIARGAVDTTNFMPTQATTEGSPVPRVGSTYTPLSQSMALPEYKPVPEYSPVSESTPLPEETRAPQTKVLVAMPEMESWEVAPGHIRDGQKGGRHENVAFSNAYITSNSAICISPDVGFNVATIKPGSSYKLEANPRVLRVCSVASGKLRVKLDENKFRIGCNGVFKVRGGSTMKVENRLYVDSVLHITSISEY